MKQMNKINQLSTINSASYFTKDTLQNVVGGNNKALSANILRWIENEKLIKIKKGLYVTREYFLQCQNKQDYSEFIANILKRPSYLSGEYVLQKYGILSESVFSFTSVTRKKPRSYNNKFGTYLYSNITDKLFTGYNIISKSGFQIKEATKTKALFDYLYFRLRTIPEINQAVINSFRLNLENFTKTDLIQLKYFINLLDQKKFTNLITYLRET